MIDKFLCVFFMPHSVHIYRKRL